MTEKLVSIEDVCRYEDGVIMLDDKTPAIYKCKYYRIEELVPKIMFDKHPEEFLWQCFNPGMLRVIDRLKELCEVKKGGKVPMKINDWLWGGGYSNSGLRVNWGSSGSAHWFGEGFDLKANGVSVKDMHDIIRANEKELYGLGLRRVEDLAATSKGNTPWCHVDGKYYYNTKPGSIAFFKP